MKHNARWSLGLLIIATTLLLKVFSMDTDGHHLPHFPNPLHHQDPNSDDSGDAPIDLSVPGPYEVHSEQMPKVISIEAECTKESMRVRVVFDRPYSGGIYPIHHYHDRECLLLPWGGSETEYEFDLTLDICGTSSSATHEPFNVIYMTNTLVFQYDPSFRGKWDTVRDVQCWFLDRSNHTALRGFRIELDSPTPDVFQMDDVTVDLEVKIGREPTGPDAESIIKVGDPLTLVIPVFTTKEVDVQVRQCVASPGPEHSTFDLSDDRGCILHRWLMGSWKFTRNTRNTGAAIMVYSQLNAFRFPDTYQLFIECNVEVCENLCPDHCPDYPPLDLRESQQRRKRLLGSPSMKRKLIATSSVGVAPFGKTASHKRVARSTAKFNPSPTAVDERKNISRTCLLAVSIAISCLLVVFCVSVFLLMSSCLNIKVIPSRT